MYKKNVLTSTPISASNIWTYLDFFTEFNCIHRLFIVPSQEATLLRLML